MSSGGTGGGGIIIIHPSNTVPVQLAPGQSDLLMQWLAKNLPEVWERLYEPGGGEPEPDSEG